MNVEGIENMTLYDLKEIFHAVGGLSMKKAVPILIHFQDKHGLTSKESLRAYHVAIRIFNT